MQITIGEFKRDIIGKIKEKLEVKEELTHHIYYKIFYRGKRIAKTYCSHGSEGKQISKWASSNIKRQLNLDSLKQLQQLKDCPFTSTDYLNLLKQKNVISD